jgi:hypothetical protein
MLQNVCDIVKCKVNFSDLTKLQQYSYWLIILTLASKNSKISIYPLLLKEIFVLKTYR